MTASLPKGWKRVKIADVADVRFSSVDKKSKDGEREVRLCNYMDVWKNPYIHGRLDFMPSTAKQADVDNFGLRQNDVLLTKDSETREEIAEPAVVSENIDNLVLGYHLALLRPDEKYVYGPFLAAQLRIPQFRSQFVRAASGATRYGLGMAIVKNAEVWLPPLPEQRRIAGILTSVDDAIDTTRAVIDQTRKLKAALLQDLLTNGIPGRHTQFKTVKHLGRIPAEWEVVRLGDIAAVERGRFTHRPRNDPAFYGGETPFVQTGDVVNSGDFLRGHSQTLNEKGLSVSRLFPAGTVLIVIAGSVGEPTIAGYDVAFPDSVVGITPRRDIQPLFLLRALQFVQRKLVGSATESAQANLSLELLKPLRLPLPDKVEREQIVKMSRSVEERLEKENQRLGQLNCIKLALSASLLSGNYCSRLD